MTTVYNPLSATFRERSERLEATLSGDSRNRLLPASGFWLRQRSQDGQSIINAASSRQQGSELLGVSIFTLDDADGYLGRIEAKRATLQDGFWRLEDARIYAGEAPPDQPRDLRPEDQPDPRPGPGNLRDARNGAVLATAVADPARRELRASRAVGYRLQYYQLLVLPLYLVAMVLLAAAVSLRLFRFGGVQKMVLGGVAAGFLLYVLSKVTGDLSKAEPDGSGRSRGLASASWAG